jgi:hypothetical protein
VDAFWISPTGKIIEAPKKHIDVVQDNPKLFGLSPDIFNAMYKKFKEPMGLEGKARNAIITELLMKGWIRLRNRRNSWTIQVYKLNSKTATSLWDWARVAVKNGELSRYSQLNVLELSAGNAMITKSAEEVLKGELLTERKRIKLKDLIISEVRKLRRKHLASLDTVQIK